jgi:hypothetical protein
LFKGVPARRRQRWRSLFRPWYSPFMQQAIFAALLSLALLALGGLLLRLAR